MARTVRGTKTSYRAKTTKLVKAELDNPKHVHGFNDTESPEAPNTIIPLPERLRALIQDEIGYSVRLTGIQIDVETGDGSLCIQWKQQPHKE